VLESCETGYFSQWRASPAALLPAVSRATLNPAEGYPVHAYQGNLLAQLPLLVHR
jgi:hypothetical protein